MARAKGSIDGPGPTLLVNGRPATSMSKLGLIPFFVVHYGIFWFVHGLHLAEHRSATPAGAVLTN